MKKIINISSGATYVDHIGSQTINNYNGTVNNYNAPVNNYNAPVNNCSAPVNSGSAPADVHAAVCTIAGSDKLPPAVASTRTCTLLPAEEGLPAGLTPDDARVAAALERMRAEGVFRHAYDYAWVMLLFMDDRKLGLPRHFDSPKSFLGYLSGCLGLTGCPDASSLNRKIRLTRGEYPNWRFDDAEGNEAIRRNNVANAFIGAFRRLS